MTILIVGASGATGRLLVQDLLERGEEVRVVVRSPDRLPEALRDHPSLELIHAEILELDDDAFRRLVDGCTAIASCLGHNLSLKGIFGPPRRLVTDATRRLTEAVRSSQNPMPVRFVLMNTAGNRNRDLDEPIPLVERGIVGLIRILLPPQPDNEQAADHLRLHIGQNDPSIEWVVVRPDSLINGPLITSYRVHPSPTRSAILRAGKTRRIHVAHFMAELITNDDAWQKWRGQMPVLYDEGWD